MIRNRPYVTPLMAERAAELRRNMTPEEKHMWYDYLRSCGHRIARQYIIGNYIVDFYCASAHLAIEIDGRQHYDEEERDYDERRTKYLETFGIKVVRITNDEIHKNFAGCCEMLERVMKENSKK